MNVGVQAGELWEIFLDECERDGLKPTDGAWDSWLKKAKAFQPKRSTISLLVQGAFR